MVDRHLISGIHYFLAVAETLNFRKAAQSLCIAQPALSRGVQQLEHRLGFPLLERSTRRVALTPPGEVLFRNGKQALERLERAIEHSKQVSSGVRGVLKIGYSTFAAGGPMSNIIIDFRRRYPEAHATLRLLPSSEQRDLLKQGGIDVGFMMSGISSSRSLEKILISQTPLVALVPAKHKLASSNTVTLEQLAESPLILGNMERWQEFRALVDKVTSERGVYLNIADEADDIPVLLQMVRSGFGCSILDASFGAALPPGIKAIGIKGLKATVDIVLAWDPASVAPLTSIFSLVAGAYKVEAGAA